MFQLELFHLCCLLILFQFVMFIDEVCVFIYLITTLLFFMHILTVYTTLTFSIFCKAGLV